MGLIDDVKRDVNGAIIGHYIKMNYALSKSFIRQQLDIEEEESEETKSERKQHSRERKQEEQAEPEPEKEEPAENNNASKEQSEYVQEAFSDLLDEKEDYKTMAKQFEELTVMAHNKGKVDLRKLTNQAEQCAYLALRYLYRLYEVGGISREEASKVKSNIAKRYEKDCRQEEQLDYVIRAFAEVIKKTADANERYRKDRTLDNADALCKAIDGVDVQAVKANVM